MSICMLVVSYGCGRSRIEVAKQDAADVPGVDTPEKKTVQFFPKRETGNPKRETDNSAVKDVPAGAKPDAVFAVDRKLIEELSETKKTATLVKLLNQNKAGTNDERRELISQIVGPVEEVTNIPTKDGAFYIAIATRMHPLHIRGVSPPPQVAIAFDETGRLLEIMGGEVSPDGVSGDAVELLDLGETNNWFVLVTRFERHGIFPEQSDIYVVRDQFPRAIRAYDFKLAYTAKLEGAERHTSPYFAFIKKPDVIPSDKGIGRDGKKYPLPIYWDATKGVFRGPSRMKLHDVDYFDINIAESHAFEPIDVPAPDR